jgi:hypothetical protein
MITTILKIFSSKKRDGLKVLSVDKSRFKLFTLRFSEKSVQTPSCDGPRAKPVSVICIKFAHGPNFASGF